MQIVTGKISAFKFVPLVLLAGLYLFRQDLGGFISYLQWVLMFFTLGIISLPMADLVFARFRCRGYMFARMFGLAMAGYLQWMLSSLHIVPFNVWTSYAMVLVVLALNIFVNSKTNTYAKYLSDNDLLRSSLNKEALFMALLLFWTYLRALRPEIEGLEKYMEFGFINSILRNDWMPAPDMWLAGESINYYYLGHFFSAYATRLTGIHPAIAYNLMMASLFAVSFMLSYSIGSFLVQLYTDYAAGARALRSGTAATPVKTRQHRAEVCAGLLTGAVVTLAGNLHSMVYAVLFPSRNNRDFYWFPSATRYIGFHPEVPGDGTIHEFPLYSYVVSDLHAHVINMIFVLTAIAMIMAIVVHLLERNETGLRSGPAGLLPRLPLHTFVILTLFIGLFTGMNIWDFPIYVVVTGAMLLYANLKIYDFCSKSVWMTGLQTGAIAICAYLAVLPFHLTFDSMWEGINFTSHKSRLYQLFILWGFQLFFGIALTIIMKSKYKRECKRPGRKAAKVKSGHRPLFRYIGFANPADAIVFIMFICATGLFIIPEMIYVVDIYGSQPRANTMFKLGYQAFILFALGSGYTMIRIFFEDAKVFKAKVVLAVLGVAFLGSAFVYPFYAIPQWYGNREYQGLDGTSYMVTEMRDYRDYSGASHRLSLADDYALVQYINDNIKDSPVLVEAMGDSYTINGRISANTGLPNILNWYYHEILWRNTDYAMVDERREDTHNIYRLSGSGNGTYEEAIRALLSKYKVKYIVVGEIERLCYPEMNEAVLKGFGDVVFTSGDLYMIKVR